MQKPLILTCWSNPDLVQLEAVLHRWFYEVQPLRPEQLPGALRKNAAHLLIVDTEAASCLEKALALQGSSRFLTTNLPVLVLDGEERLASPLHNFSWHNLNLPLDLDFLHGRLQEILEYFPRKHLRISVKLPGVVFRKEGCSFADILSLGTGGAFIKTGCRNLNRGETMEVVIPLMGMKKELELKSQVVYEIAPTPENNYQQGVGLSFVAPGKSTVQILRQYIIQSLREGDTPDRTILTPTGSLILPAPSLSGRGGAVSCQLSLHI